ncbi:tetratricopeptide repeat protein [Pseudodesulfovibrio mercurii]|nr:tetratricopeptide repeat protein [Pseudodesulfovibrio mercurii]
MKLLILCLTLLLPSWAVAQDIPRVCREAEALSTAPDGDPAEELRLYEQCLDQNPAPRVRASALFNMGVTYQDLGQWRQALDRYASAVRVNPGDYQSYSNMAWILATCVDDSVRDGKRALEFSRKACSLSADLGTLDTHAAALARNGRFDEAASLERQLIEQARKIEGFPAELTAEMEHRLALYASGAPYTEATRSTTY